MTADTPDVMIEWLSKALELQPNHYAARQARVSAYYGLKDYPTALRDAQRSVALDPGNSLYMGALGRALFKAGKYEAVKEEFGRVFQAGGNAFLRALAYMIRYAIDTAAAGNTRQYRGRMAVPAHAVSRQCLSAARPKGKTPDT